MAPARGDGHAPDAPDHDHDHDHDHDNSTVMESLADQLGWVLDEIDQGHLQADEDARLRLQSVLADLDRATHPHAAVSSPRAPGSGLSPRS